MTTFIKEMTAAMYNNLPEVFRYQGMYLNTEKQVEQLVELIDKLGYEIVKKNS